MAVCRVASRAVHLFQPERFAVASPSVQIRGLDHLGCQAGRRRVMAWLLLGPTRPAAGDNWASLLKRAAEETGRDEGGAIDG